MMDELAAFLVGAPQGIQLQVPRAGGPGSQVEQRLAIVCTLLALGEVHGISGTIGCGPVHRVLSHLPLSLCILFDDGESEKPFFGRDSVGCRDRVQLANPEQAKSK